MEPPLRHGIGIERGPQTVSAVARTRHETCEPGEATKGLLVFDLVAVPLLLQFVAPLALLAWLAVRNHGSRAELLVGGILAAAYLTGIASAGLWLVLPPVLPVIYLLLFILALGRAWRRAPGRDWWPTGTRSRVGLLVRGALAGAALFLAYEALAGRRPPPGPAADVRFPLRGAGYAVVNGGRTRLLNAHLMTLVGTRFRRYRGQSYGVDLVRLDRWGRHAQGILPGSPEAYVIFGDSVFAPCDGVVVEAVDGVADMRPPRMDREHMAGNHVLIDRGGTWILLGHLRAGSVQVRAGDAVDEGDYLGNVGNSGNTAEPHLHIHAQLPGTDAAPLSGDPLPITFDGRSLARNARVSTP